MSRSGKIKHPRNAHINQAIPSCRRLFTRSLLKKRLLKESAMVADDSMAVLGEFEKFEESAFLEDWKTRTR